MKQVLQQTRVLLLLLVAASLTRGLAKPRFLRLNGETKEMFMTERRAEGSTASTTSTTVQKQVATTTTQKITSNGEGCTNCVKNQKVQATNSGCAGGGCGSSSAQKPGTKSTTANQTGTAGCAGRSGCSSSAVQSYKKPYGKKSKGYKGAYGSKSSKSNAYKNNGSKSSYSKGYNAYGSKNAKSKGFKAYGTKASKSKKYKVYGSKAAKSKGAKYAEQCVSSNGCCVVNLASESSGSCVPGTTVQFMTADQTTVIDSFTVSSAYQCSYMFDYGQQSAEHYCINVVPTSGNECEGSCITPLTTDTSCMITYINTHVLTTTTITTTSTTNTGTQATNSAPPVSMTGSVSVRLFLDNNKNQIQETTDEDLTGLQIKLIDSNLNEQIIMSTCNNDVFLNVKPGKYTITSQMALGYACDCSKTVTVVAGVESVVTVPYTQSLRK